MGKQSPENPPYDAVNTAFAFVSETNSSKIKLKIQLHNLRRMSFLCGRG